MPGKRATAVNLILLLLSVAVSLVLLEGLYRFYLFGWASLSVERMNSLHDLANSDLRRPSTQDGLVYELRPNLSTYYKLVPFETNSVGLRDGEYGTTKPRHVYRIAVVGDSYTVPSGVRVEDAYHTLLENRLNAGSRRTRYEVINFGVPGYALRQYREVIRSKVSA